MLDLETVFDADAVEAGRFGLTVSETLESEAREADQVTAWAARNGYAGEPARGVLAYLVAMDNCAYSLGMVRASGIIQAARRLVPELGRAYA